MRSDGSIRLAGKALVEVMGWENCEEAAYGAVCSSGYALDLGFEEL